MSDLYLMRHGETLFNLRRKIQGWCDSPLTPEGIEQARRAGALLAARGVTFDHAYCSTAERTADTLEGVLSAGDLLRTDRPASAGETPAYTRVKDLRERGFGMFESESEDLNPPVEQYDSFFPPFGGETTSQVRERMARSLTQIMQRPGHESVLAVSHAGACRCFASFVGDPAEIIPGGKLPNCAIMHFTFDGERFSFAELLLP